MHIADGMDPFGEIIYETAQKSQQRHERTNTFCLARLSGMSMLKMRKLFMHGKIIDKMIELSGTKTLPK